MIYFSIPIIKTYGCEQRRLFNAFDENDHRYDGNKVSTKEIFNHEQMQDLYTIRQIRGKGNSSKKLERFLVFFFTFK